MDPYNGIYTGQELDAAITVVREKESVWDDAAATVSAVRGLSGTQLLDNAYWAIPDCIINQLGVSGTITTPGYFIDRWKLISGSVTIAEGGLLLNGTMVQILETDPGQEVTASYLTDDGVLPAEYDSETKTFAITAAGTLIRAAKLEPGSVSTVGRQDANGNWRPNDPLPNKTLELLKCQRYQTMIKTAVSGGLAQAKNMYISASLTVALRAPPEISYGSMSVYRGVKGERIAITDISVLSMDDRSIYLRVTMGESLPDGTVCSIDWATGGYILLDSNLRGDE